MGLFKKEKIEAIEINGEKHVEVPVQNIISEHSGGTTAVLLKSLTTGRFKIKMGRYVSDDYAVAESLNGNNLFRVKKEENDKTWVLKHGLADTSKNILQVDEFLENNRFSIIKYNDRICLKTGVLAANHNEPAIWSDELIGFLDRQTGKIVEVGPFYEPKVENNFYSYKEFENSPRIYVAFDKTKFVESAENGYSAKEFVEIYNDYLTGNVEAEMIPVFCFTDETFFKALLNNERKKLEENPSSLQRQKVEFFEKMYDTVMGSSQENKESSNEPQKE